jgi:hypothetical protein
MPTKFRTESLDGRGNLEDLVVDGRIILKWILRKSGGRLLLDSSDSG